jgi:hypothetical protein
MMDQFLSATDTTNAQDLLERVWPELVANDGRLLNRLLDRFMFVATLPDPRLSQIAESAEDLARFEHAFRIPFWPHWGPVLTVLQAHSEDVVRIAPIIAAKVCSLWLRTIPTELDSGRAIPWRNDAAKLAIATGREIQAREAEGQWMHSKHHGVVYEAVLYASPDLPDEAAVLCLELAQRRDLSPGIQARVESARREREDQHRRLRKANPQRLRRLGSLTSPMFRGERRDPWFDGPHGRVDRAFRETCLNSMAFSTFARIRPEAALEILLAVCIEEAQDEPHYGGSMLDECGLEHWQEGYPPLYFRGPFLRFLRAEHDYGLSFVLRIVNFATHRYSDNIRRKYGELAGDEINEGVKIVVDGHPRRWIGDVNVFEWHNDRSRSHLITCALMAVERWLYEQLEMGKNVEPSLRRIIAESESVAFAGLLIDVGKRQPQLFTAVLFPLVRAWELYEFDSGATVQRMMLNTGLMGWGMEPQKLAAAALKWYTLRHRRQFLRDIMARIMLFRKELRPFFEELRTDWRTRLDAQGRPESLRLLIERLNPENYKEGRPDEEGKVPAIFKWPEEIERKNAEDMVRRNREMQLRGLPMQCRRPLDEKTLLSQDEIAAFWNFLQTIDVNRNVSAADGSDRFAHLGDALCAGIAVMLVSHYDWVAGDPERMNWCRRTLEAVAQKPPERSPLDQPTSMGNIHWGAFIGESGVALLARDPDDGFARRLVSTGVIAYHYETTTVTMNRAFERRDELKEDFERMISLALRSAGMRVLHWRASELELEVDRTQCDDQQMELVQAFGDRSLPAAIPDLQALNEAGLLELGRLHDKHFSDDVGGFQPMRRKRVATGPHDKLRPVMIAIDTTMITAALRWLDIGVAQSFDERRKWLGLVKDLRTLSLATLPEVEDAHRQEIDGLPTDFDDWVYRLVAQTIPQMSPEESPDCLWKPILDLGVPAHHWVERFFWEWFTDGAALSGSPADFTQKWTEMICYALNHPFWDPATNRTSDLAEMVCELLGFRFGATNLGENTKFTEAIGRMADTFELAAKRWFGLSGVASGFAAFAAKPAAAQLLVPGLKWLAGATCAFSDQDWKHYDLEETLVAFLRVCWEKASARVSSDPQLRGAFLDLLTQLNARGGHAATALRDRVLDSLGN